ncbi:threonylcarbamoyl-AMP synthase [Candidatus Woesearchaeota archaeon]|nr:threonylcarbamoyl-AMP synthase [Candidatus Woesearchaeota archaeon]
MAAVISASEYHKQKSRILKQIKQGLVFIYPTDTIYGIGCDATNKDAVARIRKAKQRDAKPFSVIAPSKSWIAKNCKVTAEARKWLARLPGPYTLILNLQESRCVAENVTQGSGTLGVRIPGNWSAQIAATLGKPIVSTSANLTTQQFMTSLENLDGGVKQHVDLIIYEGEKKARPSKLVDLTGKKARIIAR